MLRVPVDPLRRALAASGRFYEWVLIEPGAVVATDGRRLHRVAVDPTQISLPVGYQHGATIHLADAKKIAQSGSADGVTCHPSSQFPPYGFMMQCVKSPLVSMTVQRRDIARAAQSAAHKWRRRVPHSARRRHTRFITLELRDGAILIDGCNHRYKPFGNAVNVPVLELVRDETRLNNMPYDCTFYLQMRYVEDAIRAARHQVVRICINGSTDPIVLTTEDFAAFIMPAVPRIDD